MLPRQGTSRFINVIVNYLPPLNDCYNFLRAFNPTRINTLAKTYLSILQEHTAEFRRINRLANRSKIAKKGGWSVDRQTDLLPRQIPPATTTAAAAAIPHLFPLSGGAGINIPTIAPQLSSAEGRERRRARYLSGEVSSHEHPKKGEEEWAPEDRQKKAALAWWGIFPLCEPNCADWESKRTNNGQCFRTLVHAFVNVDGPGGLILITPTIDTRQNPRVFT